MTAVGLGQYEMFTIRIVLLIYFLWRTALYRKSTFVFPTWLLTLLLQRYATDSSPVGKTPRNFDSNLRLTKMYVISENCGLNKTLSTRPLRNLFQMTLVRESVYE